VAVRVLRKQPYPKEIMLKPAILDKSNTATYEMPVEQRACPPLEAANTK
jgi:ribose transport system substrate-binding protein